MELLANFLGDMNLFFGWLHRSGQLSLFTHFTEISPHTTSQFGYLTLYNPQNNHKNSPSSKILFSGDIILLVIFTGCFGLQDKSSATALKACLNLLHCVKETRQPFSRGHKCDSALEEAFRLVGGKWYILKREVKTISKRSSKESHS